jgi:membrane-associated protein
VVSRILDNLLNAPTWLVFSVVGLLVFAEDALFVGFLIPGETAAVIGGVAASRGRVSLLAVIVVVVFCAVVGDSVGYLVGRKFGTRILELPRLAKRRARLATAQDNLARRGGSAVFLGRFVAFLRAVMPALAGTAKMAFGRFLTYNAAGGIIWGTGFVVLGDLAGNSYAAIAKIVGRGAALAVAGLVIVAVLVWGIRQHRKDAAGARR